MIANKSELKRVLAAEAAYYHVKWYYHLPFYLTESQVLYKHAQLLRKAEYAQNTHKWSRHWYLFRLLRIQTKYELIIPLNVLEPGFMMPHLGPVVINAQSHIGKNCCILPGILIGANKGCSPQIGDDCWLGPGAKIYGDVTLADHISVGANAVVTKSCTVPGAHLLGVPAKAYLDGKLISP